MALAVERVEGMEELLLGAIAAGEELHIVEDERIDAAELIAELGGLVAPNRVDELVHEDFRRHEENFLVAIALPNLMPDRIDQVGLAEADPAVNEERVVFFAGLIRDRQRRGMRELISRTDHEFGESITRVQLRMAIALLHFSPRAHHRRSMSSIAIAVCVSIAVAGLDHHRAVFAEGQFDVDRFADFGGK